MSSRLPDRPSMGHLRNEAKALSKARTTGDAKALRILRHLPQLEAITDAELREVSLPLQKVQHALALEYGFSSWKDLKDEVALRRMLDERALGRALRSEGVRGRSQALRKLAIALHPNWQEGTPWGWGLSQPSHAVPEGIDAVAAMRMDSSWRIRLETVRALAAYVHLGDILIEKTLQQLLQDERHAVQHGAARALGVRCPGCGGTPELSEYVEG